MPLILQVEYPDREGYVCDATENLSAGGAFVRTDRALKVGERATMMLSFPGLLEPLSIVGEVAWVRPAQGGMPAGVGVKIPEDRAEDRAKLATLLKSQEVPTPAAEAGPFRVLLVEDNPHITELYEYVMRKLAQSDQLTLEVAIAKDGFDALERLTKEKFDLVVTDLYMPVLDGFELIKRLRSDPRTRDVPIVAISAGGTDAQAQARSVGASVFLRKPVRFLDVLETVKSLLRI